MDTLEINDLRVLTTAESEPCVSIYMPTQPSGRQGQQDPVRLKNLTRQVEAQLVSQWLRPVEARQFLQPVSDLLVDEDFWSQCGRGLAVFVTSGSFYRFRLDVQLDELTVVHRRFHVKPLLSVVTGQDRFYILALSQNSVRLFEASRYQIKQCEVKDLPANMKDALNYTAADRGSQVHSAMRGSLGKQAAVFHAQGGQQDTRKSDLATFFRQVDAALQPLLRDQAAPLLLAGVDHVVSIYRKENHYSRLAEPELKGNCDHLTPHEIHERAWPLIEPVVEQARQRAATRYFEMVNTGKTSDDVRRILPAAHEGRIDSLFVDEREHQWGAFDPVSAAVDVHERCQQGDDDLLDLAAVQTLLHRGTVYCRPRDQLPDQQPITALLRY